MVGGRGTMTCEVRDDDGATQQSINDGSGDVWDDGGGSEIVATTARQQHNNTIVLSFIELM